MWYLNSRLVHLISLKKCHFLHTSKQISEENSSCKSHTWIAFKFSMRALSAQSQTNKPPNVSELLSNLTPIHYTQSGTTNWLLYRTVDMRIYMRITNSYVKHVSRWFFPKAREIHLCTWTFTGEGHFKVSADLWHGLKLFFTIGLSYGYAFH